MKLFGVIGAGTMGAGIAQKIAIEGGNVTVLDVSQEALDRGKGMMDAVFKESIERKLSTEDQVSHIRKSITFSTDIETLKDADFIVEAVFEDKNVKQDIFTKLEKVVGEGAIIASNTSSFRIAEMAEGFRRPERFVGLHFFYHPVKNRLLEIIPGPKTSSETVEEARRFCAFLGKVDILCKDSPGFVVNRFFVPWLNESVRLLAEKKATIGEIETAVKKGFKLGMGPFELMNVTGVPIAVHAASGLADVLGNFYRPDLLLISQAKKGLWELPVEAEQEISDDVYNEVFNRLLGVTIAISSILIEEGGVAPLDIDLGARIGLRWPKGPVSLFNQASEEKRAAIIFSFKERHPQFILPRTLTSETVFTLPTVTEDTIEIKINNKIERIHTLSLARPDYSNALNETVFEELDEAVSRSVGKAPVLVIKGKGKNFAAGADIKYFIKNIENNTIDRIVEFTKNAQDTIARIDRFPGKVIAVIDGFALGGGAELMLSADVVVATPRALIGFPETGIGIYPGLGGTYRLTLRLGKELAKYLVGTGQMVSGEEAEKIGLVDYCLAPENITPGWLFSLEPRKPADLPPKWKNIATFMGEHSLDDLLEKSFAEEWQSKIQHKLRTKAPVGLRLALEFIEKAATCDYEEAAARELGSLNTIFRTEDALTGLKSVGKSRPQFKGK